GDRHAVVRLDDGVLGKPTLMEPRGDALPDRRPAHIRSNLVDDARYLVADRRGELRRVLPEPEIDLGRAQPALLDLQPHPARADRRPVAPDELDPPGFGEDGRPHPRCAVESRSTSFTGKTARRFGERRPRRISPAAIPFSTSGCPMVVRPGVT